MKNESIIEARGVSKKFCRMLSYTMYYGVRDITKGVFCLPAGSERLREKEFWALDDVSFQVSGGEALGIIGVNGSGKSTLLKMINGIFMPDRGSLIVRGSVGALIELGAGFHPMLTGRENIYVNGIILGMSMKEIDKKFESIVNFADIGDFLDSPVKYYSSGMHVRLGFSIAIHSDQEILLIDEVLSVGDYSFREKCMKRMRAIRDEGRTIVFVSHSLGQIEAMCDRVILLDGGRMKTEGKARDVVNEYVNMLEKKEIGDIKALESGTASLGSDSIPVCVDKVNLIGKEGIPKSEFAFGEKFTVRICFNAKRKIAGPLFNIRIMQAGYAVTEAGMLMDGPGPDWIEGTGFVECEFLSMPLVPNVYDIMLFGRSADGIADIIRSDIYARFRVTDENTGSIPLKGPMAVVHFRGAAAVYLPRKWRWGQEIP